MKLKSILLALALTASSALYAQELPSGLSRANMNTKVKPGNDFFEYAAGGWMKAHPLTPEYSRYTQFEELSELNTKQLQSLIEEYAKGQYPQGSLQQKIGALYRLANDSVRLNREGYAPLKNNLALVRGIKDKKQYEMVAYALTRAGVQTMFGFYAGADIKDARVNLLDISQSGLSMGNRDLYLDSDAATLKIRNAYKDYVVKLFTMVGVSEQEAKAKMEDLMRIETRLAKAQYDVVKLREPEANYHKMTYMQLLADFGGIDWNAALLQSAVPPVKHVTVGQPEFLHEVEAVLAEESLEALKNYTEFKLINDAASALSDDFRAAYFNFYGTVKNGAPQDRPRWKRANATVQSVLGMAVGKMYVEKYFPESSKKQMEELVHNLQIALGQRIDMQDWMSAETKKRAHEKLDAFYVKVGYPNKWVDYTALNIDENLSLYENLYNAAIFENDRHFSEHVNKPVDRDEWLMNPQEINAYYNPTTNEICFPAGILQPPFFDPNVDDACNYGAIGVVIGHEMTHGFDDKGSQYDKDGNLNDWWTAEDKANFKARTDQMAAFFDKQVVLPGLHANGKLTNGENIADHGGLNIAFLALHNAMKEKPLGIKDGFTPEQRFYLSYGLIWATNVREEALRSLAMTDPHSPARLRVNAALPHIDAWYEAFGVKKGNKLFLPKEQRVDVW